MLSFAYFFSDLESEDSAGVNGWACFFCFSFPSDWDLIVLITNVSIFRLKLKKYTNWIGQLQNYIFSEGQRHPRDPYGKYGWSTLKVYSTVTQIVSKRMHMNQEGISFYLVKKTGI